VTEITFVIPEILFHQAGLHQSLPELRGDQLVQLEGRRSHPLRPVPHCGRVRLQTQRLVRRHPDQGHIRAEHLQALLF